MADNANKIGHRNYALIDIASLTEEEKEAVKSSHKEYIGYVPWGYKIYDKDRKHSIFYYRVFFSKGYTLVFDKNWRLRFIHHGFLTTDEVSLKNKGNTVAFMNNYYNKLILQEKFNLM